MIKDCSVCTCQDNEIPLPWLAHSMSSSLPAYSEEFIGWVSPSTSSYGFGGKGHDESLGVLDYGSNSKKKGQKGYNSSLTSNYVKHLIETEQNELGNDAILHFKFKVTYSYIHFVLFRGLDIYSP
jgi:hypothetical protein